MACPAYSIAVPFFQFLSLSLCSHDSLRKRTPMFLCLYLSISFSLCLSICLLICYTSAVFYLIFVSINILLCLYIYYMILYLCFFFFITSLRPLSVCLPLFNLYLSSSVLSLPNVLSLHPLLAC